MCRGRNFETPRRLEKFRRSSFRGGRMAFEIVQSERATPYFPTVKERGERKRERERRGRENEIRKREGEAISFLPYRSIRI